jgi:hypothetical protein
MGSKVLRSHLGIIQEVANMAAEHREATLTAPEFYAEAEKIVISVAYAHEMAGSPEMLAEKSRRSGGAVFSC